MSVEPIQFPGSPPRQQVDLGAIIQAAVDAAVADALRDQRPPQVTVQPAPVTVTASAPPTVQVTVPECGHTDPEINLDVPGMSEVTARLASIDTNLQKLLAVLSLPITRTVERGAGNLIESITEHRR